MKIHSDSQLVVNQVFGEYTAKDARIEAYLRVVHSLLKNFEEHTIQQISRDLNTQADTLATFGSTSEPNIHRSIPIGFITRPNIKVEVMSTAEEVGEDWRTLF